MLILYIKSIFIGCVLIVLNWQKVAAASGDMRKALCISRFVDSKKMFVHFLIMYLNINTLSHILHYVSQKPSGEKLTSCLRTSEFRIL